MQIFFHATEVFIETPSETLGNDTDFYIASLLSNLGSVVTFNMNTQLRKLADTTKEPAVLDFLQSGSYDNYETRLAGTKFLPEFLEFLDDFGYRAINELEAASVRWDEDPSFLFEQILTLSQRHNDTPGTASVEDRKKTEDLLVAQVPFLQRYITRWTIGKLQDYTRLRENAKCVLVQFIALLRHYLLHAASLCVAQGILAKRDDVFLLTNNDVDEVLGLEDRPASPELFERIRKTVREYEAEIESQRKLAFPELFIGNAPRFAPIKTEAGSTSALSGIGASCGVVQGIARILYSPKEHICASTDPAWTPLFARCAALVSVHGGMLSHGAIVAREFGIPAVLGVSNALAVIKDGIKLNVDGNSGIVTILSD